MSCAQDNRYIDLFNKICPELENTTENKIDTYRMYASLVPDLALNIDLRDSLVDNYIKSYQDPTAVWIIDIYKKYLTLTELDSLVRLKNSDDYLKVAAIDKWMPSNLRKFVENVCNEVVGGKVPQDLNISDVPNDYLLEFNRNVDFDPKGFYHWITFNLDQSVYSKEYTGQRKRVEDYLNRNLTRYALKELYKSGYKKSDLYLIKKIRQNRLITKDHEIVKAMVDLYIHNYSTLLNNLVIHFSKYLKESGYEIPEVYLKRIKQESENIGAKIRDIYSD